MKILRKEKLGSPDGFEIQRFIHEIEMLKRLDHPNIIKLYEFYEDDKRYYLVMELCTGGELFDEIAQRGHFDEPEAAAIIQQILAAVAYCHRQNIVHRDLKPENILIDQRRSNTIKVTDFGASATYKPKGQKKAKNHKYIKDTVGSAYYVAPEVLTSEYDEKCDIWSVGAIMYTMLAGRPPFEGKSELEIIKSVKTGIYDLTIPQLQAVSPEAKALIAQLLQFDPERRTSADQALNHPWIKMFDDTELD